MKRALVCGILVVAIVCGFAFSPAAQEVVEIGCLFPFSGPLALLGQETFNGAELARIIVNEQGGVFGKPIEWVKGDAVETKAAVAEAERLITVKKVKVIFGTYSSSLSYAASSVAERYGVIYWEQGGIADDITARGFKYLFRTIPTGSNMGISAVNYAAQVVAPALGIDVKKLKVAIVHEDTLYGTTVGSNASKRAIELGMNVVSVDGYNNRAVDLSSLIIKLKASKPDVLVATSYVNDGILFYRQMKEYAFNVKAFIGTGAVHGMPDFVDTFGREVDGVINFDPPSRTNPAAINPDVNPGLEEFQRRFEEMFGHEPLTHATAGFVSAMVLFQDVLPRAGSLDPEAIRKAALETDIPDGSTVGYWGVKFAPPDHPMAGQNLRASMIGLQWQDGELQPIYPEVLATRKVRLPFPEWKER